MNSRLEVLDSNGSVSKVECRNEISTIIKKKKGSVMKRVNTSPKEEKFLLVSGRAKVLSIKRELNPGDVLTIKPFNMCSLKILEDTVLLIQNGKVPRR
jgi:hypothetical protein